MRTPKGSSGLRLSVETVIDDHRWDCLEFGEVCRSACNAALSAADIEPGNYEIGILGCCDERIAGLNRRFRDNGGPDERAGMACRTGSGGGEPDLRNWGT